MADVLGGKLSVISEGDSEEYLSHGADKVYLLEKSIPFKVDTYTEVITSSFLFTSISTVSSSAISKECAIGVRLRYE